MSAESPYSDAFPEEKASGQTRTETKGRGGSWKPWVLGIALLLILIIALQNAQEVEMDFLFIHTEAPLFAALVIAAVLGAVIGYVTALLRHRHND